MMNQKPMPIFIGDTTQKQAGREIKGEYVSMYGDIFYKIENYDAMEPFFMSVISSSNHWLFISSTGGLSAGRVNAEQSLFPYYTVDKLTENNENTGNKAILLVTRNQVTSLWEPFSERQRGNYLIERNIFKNVTGTMLLFEEENHSLGLTYRYAWRTSDRFGFIKTGWLVNWAETTCQVELLDGIQNILPANVSMLTQITFSSLLDAYKRSELDTQTGLGIFALNSTLTDLAEPSESLLATTVFQVGLEQARCLLSSRQLDQFRTGLGINTETEVRGQRGAYFAQASLQLSPNMEHTWHLVADVNQDSAAIVARLQDLHERKSEIVAMLEADMALNSANLERIVASADGLQVSSNPLCTSHHFANVMFNVMRGGIFADGYRIDSSDFIEFISIRNHAAVNENAAFFADLPAKLDSHELQTRALASANEDLQRLSYAYLPLSFSRRHGDPSRPWNRFAIDIKKIDGSAKLGYEGNWRDIYQNWEALAYSYPEYIESMICTFLNATTVDGYNPYRITSQGIDWELPEPDNPWANIGYWSDHQIIYLQKLVEISARVHPGKLSAFLSQRMFSYANVPYRLKTYADIQKDPYNTIDFNWDLQRQIETRVPAYGTDGKLVFMQSGGVLHVTLTEKLLTLLLAKLANFVPEGGIWMNTQRPEWNDANNALVGKGLSVVTLGYLLRSIVFYQKLLQENAGATLEISLEVVEFYTHISKILNSFQDSLQGSFDDESRRAMMDALGQAGSDYRWKYYSLGLSGETGQLPSAALLDFLKLAQRYVEHSLRANKRSDNLYHSYNTLRLHDKAASISHLYEMLEGQVSILSSGLLSGNESLTLLQNLRQSQLYRADQNSYILYPDRKLAGFLERNCLSAAQVSGLALVTELEKAKDKSLFTRDINGVYHFSGHIRNLKDVNHALEALKTQPRFAGLVTGEADRIRALFEHIFQHDEFTGRSGTFFAYEGLGSVYWHMVSKLLLAAQETVIRTKNQPTELINQYADIRSGLSFNKSPHEYGAFPTDPYSHTPGGLGARQPGMTGMVKEEILTRQAELGYGIENGQLKFDFLLLDRNEFLKEETVFSAYSPDGKPVHISLPAGSMGYSICQTPVILQGSDQDGITIHLKDGSAQSITGLVLDIENSRHIFQRDGVVRRLVVTVRPV